MAHLSNSLIWRYITIANFEDLKAENKYLKSEVKRLEEINFNLNEELEGIYHEMNQAMMEEV